MDVFKRPIVSGMELGRRPEVPELPTTIHYGDSSTYIHHGRPGVLYRILQYGITFPAGENEIVLPNIDIAGFTIVAVQKATEAEQVAAPEPRGEAIAEPLPLRLAA